jgi:hypothetical protein
MNLSLPVQRHLVVFEVRHALHFLAFLFTISYKSTQLNQTSSDPSRRRLKLLTLLYPCPFRRQNIHHCLAIQDATIAQDETKKYGINKHCSCGRYYVAASLLDRPVLISMLFVCNSYVAKERLPFADKRKS